MWHLEYLISIHSPIRENRCFNLNAESFIKYPKSQSRSSHISPPLWERSKKYFFISAWALWLQQTIKCKVVDCKNWLSKKLSLRLLIHTFMHDHAYCWVIDVQYKKAFISIKSICAAVEVISYPVCTSSEYLSSYLEI